MKERVLSLFVVLCLCIAVIPIAFADGVDFSVDDVDIHWNEDLSGDGWRCVADARKLILNNYHGNSLVSDDIEYAGLYTGIVKTLTIDLENGSKNTVKNIAYMQLVFEGDGELVIYSKQLEESAIDFPVLMVTPGYSITFKDSLTMKGGQKKGDQYPLMVNSEGKVVTEDGKCAYYVRIAPADSFNVSTPDSKFSDVKKGDWFYNSVLWATQENITTGTSATTFTPDRTCTRGEILTFLWRAVGSPAPTIVNPYSDVKESDYYYNAALWAYERNMLIGQTVFEADTPCTRASTVVYIYRSEGRNGTWSGDLYFSDVPSNAYYTVASGWAFENNITEGTGDGLFSPDKTCTRAEIMTFLYRAFG